MRGFPIRTSSDHGSFANSPRLIAGYHVLLRLLVPRHPPCALKNLTTKTYFKDARVHCAVLEQRTIPESRAPAPTSSQKGSRRFVRPTGPVMKQPPSRAVPSGPNSVPRRPARPGGARSIPRRGVLTRCRPERAAVVDVPPVSTTPNAYGSGLVSAHPHRGGRVRSSLERR